jgi:hypothetical protein
MPTATLYRGLQSTFADSPSPAANLKVTVARWAKATDPRVSPLLDKIGFGASINERPVYFGQSRRHALQTTAAEALAQGETDLDVAAGLGKIFKKGSTFEIIDFIAGSTTIEDEATKEICFVTSVATDTLTITRGESGTSDVAHASGANIYLLAPVEKENETTRELDAVSRGYQFYNYFQRLHGGVGADIAAQHQANWEYDGNPMTFDMAEVRKKLHVLLERQIWRGGRSAGSSSEGATFGGLDTFITTNVTNLANAKITPNLLEAEIRDLVKTVDGGGEGLTFLMSFDTAAILDRVINPIRQATASDTKLKLYVDAIQFRFGTFDIVTSHNCRNGVIYAVHTDQLKVHPFEGADWHLTKKDGKLHGVDHDQVWVSGDFTFILQQEQTMFKLYGFNQNESVYQGYQTFNS